MEALTELTIYTDGNIEPDISPKTEVILIQDGLVKVGRLLFEKDIEDSLQIEHPNNEEDINKLALDLITSQRPQYLKEDEDAIVVTCPDQLNTQMEWN